MDLATALATGIGLAVAAGLNAYIPLLVVGLLGQTGVLDLPAPYDNLQSTPVLATLAVLLVVELVADKVPAVDSLNDAVMTIGRPAAGAVLFAGSVGIGTDLPPWVGVVAGLITSGSVHGVKATIRPVANVSTFGVAAPVLSVAEDGVSLVSSVLAVLAPLLAMVFLLVTGWFTWRWWRDRRRRRAAGTAATSEAL